MQTRFTLAQLADPEIREADAILRACVHCGLCMATCPTYVLTGDELDGPRGRIYLIKNMLEGARPAGRTLATHIDRCLSCLSCMTTCPSSVDYMHLVDLARRRIVAGFKRPLADRLLRHFLAFVLPRPVLFRAGLVLGRLARPAAGIIPRRLRALVSLAPAKRPAPAVRPGIHPAEGVRRYRVALAPVCVHGALAPAIDSAAIRLLARHGCEVVVGAGSGCCGALAHHLEKETAALSSARANIDRWTREADGNGLDAVIVTASGCGTMIKDYGYLFRDQTVWAEKAARVSGLARDISEWIAEIGLQSPAAASGLRIAYHGACSLTHGQRIVDQPKVLLHEAGFSVSEPPESHLCCGSAGTYNILEPGFAGALGARKTAALESLAPDAIASGNIGCIVQIAAGTDVPVVHTAELLDWATGGPKPEALGGRQTETIAT